MDIGIILLAATTTEGIRVHLLIHTAALHFERVVASTTTHPQLVSLLLDLCTGVKRGFWWCLLVLVMSRILTNEILREEKR
jgi:hypothetical protein